MTPCIRCMLRIGMTCRSIDDLVCYLHLFYFAIEGISQDIIGPGVPLVNAQTSMLTVAFILLHLQ